MKRPSLSGIAEWIGTDLLESVNARRRQNGEVQRMRKLGTTEMIWLMLAVSLDTGKNGLHEILRLATAEMGINWDVSVAAFCKARKFFFPQTSAFFTWTTGSSLVPATRKKPRSMERFYSQSRR